MPKTNSSSMTVARSATKVVQRSSAPAISKEEQEAIMARLDKEYSEELEGGKAERPALFEGDKKLWSFLTAVGVPKAYIEAILKEGCRNVRRCLNVRHLFRMVVEEADYLEATSVDIQEAFKEQVNANRPRQESKKPLSISFFKDEAKRLFEALCHWQIMVNACLTERDILKVFAYGSSFCLFLTHTEDTEEAKAQYRLGWGIEKGPMHRLWMQRADHQRAVKTNSLKAWFKGQATNNGTAKPLQGTAKKTTISSPKEQATAKKIKRWDLASDEDSDCDSDCCDNGLCEDCWQYDNGGEDSA
jgi:hypothetical protein